MAATLFGLALRAARLSFQPLWWDEGYSVWFATHPLGQMAALTAQDIHPPLYYALLHGWTLLFGAGPVALRLPSVIFGTLAIPAVYLAGQRLFGSRRVALLAALLLAFNPLHIFYSQEIRMYGLVALLSIGMIDAAWRLFDPETRKRGDAERFAVSPRLRVSGSSCHLVAYILLTTLALYTQYYTIFLPIGLTIYAAWHWRRAPHSLTRWLAAQAVVALLYLPWVLYAAPKLIPYVSQKVMADADRPLGPLAYLARHLAAFLAGHLEGPLAPWWPAALLLLVPIGVGWWLIATRRTANSRWQMADDEWRTANGEWPMADGRWQRAEDGRQTAVSGRRSANAESRSSAIRPLTAIILTALALGWLISLRAPFFPARGERLLMLALPAFVLLVAAGLDALWLRWRGAGYVTLGLIVATSVASLAAFYTVLRYANDDYRALIAQTIEQGQPADTVFCVYPWQMGYWRSYGDPAGPTASLTPGAAWSPAIPDALDEALSRGRVWFPAHLSLGAILETQIEAHLAAHALPFVNEWYGPNTRLSAWASADEAADLKPATVGIRFATPGGGLLTLAAVAGTTRPVSAANVVTPVELTWQADAAPPVLAVSVRLTDDLGQIWGQNDYEPLGRGGRGVACNVSTTPRPGWCATDRFGLLIPAGTPPGRYHVELVLRPKGSARALDARAADGRVLGPAARLFDIDVLPAARALGAERLPIAARGTVDLGDGLRFLGYSADTAPLTPGDLRKVSLFWEAAERPAADYVAFVQVLGRDGTPVALWEAPPGAAYATSQWAPGTLIRTQASFRVPASVPDGRYRLIAGLFHTGDKARLRTATGADSLTLGRVAVRGRPHEMTAPQPQHPAATTFGAAARLAGYDLDAAAGAPGGTLALTLHWQALAATDRPYTVFVHLIDSAGAVWGYGDAEPGSGALPTPGWLAGEYLADAHTISIAADAPAGTYRLAVGFYDPVSGERLRTGEGADQTILQTSIAIRAE